MCLSKRCSKSVLFLLALTPQAAPSLAANAKINPNDLALHQSLLTLDTHLDTPASLDRPGWSIEQRHSYNEDYSQVDLPRMVEGGLDGGFWAIYTPQGPLDQDGLERARDFAVMRGVTIREMVARDPAHFALATKAGEAAPIAASGKRIVYMSMENAYPLGEDVSMLQLFHAMGVRLLGFAHFTNNQFADSATDPAGAKWNGLSPLGEKLVAEANRLGVVLDASHSSDAVFDAFLRLSKAPFILSHSGCKAIYNHPRNLDDERLKKLAAAGGVIQINSFGSYLRAIKPNLARDAAMRSLFGAQEEAVMTADEYAAFLAKRHEIDARYPPDSPSFDDFMAHLLHALMLVGPDHVGIGLDWDGGGGVTGMEDVSSIPRITVALRSHGYGESDLRKIWGGNVLRVLAAATAEAEREAQQNIKM